MDENLNGIVLILCYHRHQAVLMNLFSLPMSVYLSQNLVLTCHPVGLHH